MLFRFLLLLPALYGDDHKGVVGDWGASVSFHISRGLPDGGSWPWRVLASLSTTTCALLYRGQPPLADSRAIWYNSEHRCCLGRSSLPDFSCPRLASPRRGVLRSSLQGELFGHILDLLGGFTGSNMTFILPSLAYLKATEGKDLSGDVKMLRRCASALLAFGLAVMVLVPAAVFVRVAGVSW